jgi:hypothetical protein
MHPRFEDFQDTLMQHLPGALPDAVQQTFFTHARRFYRRTRVWRETIPGICVTACSNVIPLNPVNQFSEVCFLESASLDGVPLTLIVVPQPWATRGRPSRIWLATPHEAHLWPTPAESFHGQVTLTVSVQPRREANRLAPEALTHHYEALVSGVLGDMLAQQKKPYTDAGLAAIHARRFETEIARLTSLRDKGYTQRSNFARPPVVALR